VRVNEVKPKMPTAVRAPPEIVMVSALAGRGAEQQHARAAKQVRRRITVLPLSQLRPPASAGVAGSAR
jgi:hypothetical protein